MLVIAINFYNGKDMDYFEPILGDYRYVEEMKLDDDKYAGVI